ncbi:hypothetical protein LINGRAHAP2_LOCUS30540 [Linum grandiflorum]
MFDALSCFTAAILSCIFSFHINTRFQDSSTFLAFI